MTSTEKQKLHFWDNGHCAAQRVVPTGRNPEELLQCTEPCWMRPPAVDPFMRNAQSRQIERQEGNEWLPGAGAGVDRECLLTDTSFLFGVTACSQIKLW